MPPLVIEFMGLPGAGKTTIAHHVIEDLTAKGCRCFAHSTFTRPEETEKRSGGVPSKMRTLGWFVTSCLAYRRLAADAFVYTMCVKSFSLHNLRRLVTLLVRFRVMKNVMDDNYDVLVLDQGPLQNLWSIATRGDVPPNARRLERVLGDVLDEVAPFVVLVDVEPDLASERVAGRRTMRSRFDRMHPAEADAILSRHGHVFAQIVELADNFAETGFLRVNGGAPIERNVALIVRFIEAARETHAR